MLSFSASPIYEVSKRSIPLVLTSITVAVDQVSAQNVAFVLTPIPVPISSPEYKELPGNSQETTWQAQQETPLAHVSDMPDRNLSMRGL